MIIHVITSQIKLPPQGLEGEWGDSVAAVPQAMAYHALQFCYDPVLLAELGQVPQVVEITAENLAALEEADVVVPYAVDQPTEDKLIELMEQGKPLLWAKPSRRVFEEMEGLRRQARVQNTLLSNREDWRVNDQVFAYPQALWFHTFDLVAGSPSSGQIGEWPDLLTYKNSKLLATDFFSALVWYRSCPEHMVGTGSFTRRL